MGLGRPGGPLVCRPGSVRMDTRVDSHQEEVWFSEAWQSQGAPEAVPSAGGTVPCMEGILQRPVDKNYLGICVHPALLSPMGAQENLALPSQLTKKT